MNPVASLDIEIIPDPRAAHLVPEKGKGERTDPWDKLKFDSNFNLVCCWAMFDGETTLSDIINEPYGEPEILESLWNAVAEYSQIITFNGLAFDVPFILKRSWYNRIVPRKQLSLKRYQSPDQSNHIDLRCLLSNWDSYAKGSLDIYSRLALGEDKGGIDGSMVADMWKDGKQEEIRKYCENDARITYKLYESMKGFYL